MTQKDYQELMEFLAAQFDQIHHKLDQKADKADLADKADKKDLALLSLNLKEELDNKADKEDISRLYDHIDAYAQRVDTYSQEMELLAGQVSRHERWHQQTANKLKIKY